MTTRYECHEVSAVGFSYVAAGTRIGEDVYETPALLLASNEVSVLQGTSAELRDLLRRVLARLDRAPDPAPPSCERCDESSDEVGELSAVGLCEGCADEVEHEGERELHASAS